MSTVDNGSQTAPQTAFEQQRAALVGDVMASMENVLQKLNHLNRNLEGIIAVGTELSQVESLWSQFEGVMAKETPEQAEAAVKQTTTDDKT